MTSDSGGTTDTGLSLFYVLDVMVAARAVFGFFRIYFQTKFHEQALSDPSQTTCDNSGMHEHGSLDCSRKLIDHSQIQPSTNDIAQDANDDQLGCADSQGCSSSAVHVLNSAPIRKKIRVYMDGCFDCMHFGHANALRQAKALGDILVVGINPEVEIRKHKGPPVMSDAERFVAVNAVKWVDEVLTDVPYEVTPEFLDKLVNEHHIDIIVHGDDPCHGADGQDVYKAVKDMGRFRTIKRTEGVSSTDIVGRMLLCTRDHHLDHLDHYDHNRRSEDDGHDKVQSADSGLHLASPTGTATPFARVSTFLPTTRRLIQFAGGPRAPGPNDRVVYCDGTFDMFHAGHIETLREASLLGDFLLVGIHDDATVNAHKGSNFPIMNLHERTLSVLSCKYVDEVIIGAPWCITEDMITTMNISVVVHGTHHDPHFPGRQEDPYSVPKRLDMYVEVKSVSELTVPVILNRIVQNRKAFLARNEKKEKSENEYLTKHKVYVPER